MVKEHYGRVSLLFFMIDHVELPPSCIEKDLCVQKQAAGGPGQRIASGVKKSFAS